MTERLQGLALGPDWRVSVHTGTELVLTRLSPGWRQVGGALTVSFGATALAVALALASEPEARLITWPVSALLLVVAGLALPAAVRNLRRARLGVALRFTPDAVEGWPVAMSFGPRRRTATDIQRVSVRLFAHPPLSLALLEVELKDGTRLAGPELAFPRGEAHPLDQVGRAAAALCGAEFAGR